VSRSTLSAMSSGQFFCSNAKLLTAALSVATHGNPPVPSCWAVASPPVANQRTTISSTTAHRGVIDPSGSGCPLSPAVRPPTARQPPWMTGSSNQNSIIRDEMNDSKRSSVKPTFRASIEFLDFTDDRYLRHLVFRRFADELFSKI
jgi:hypothetical protein